MLSSQIDRSDVDRNEVRFDRASGAVRVIGPRKSADKLNMLYFDHDLFFAYRSRQVGCESGFKCLMQRIDANRLIVFARGCYFAFRQMCSRVGGHIEDT
jgi:hypothetical protein